MSAIDAVDRSKLAAFAVAAASSKMSEATGRRTFSMVTTTESL
jgi:hypothetical protein